MAAADTVDRTRYHDRLIEARASLVQARQRPAAERDPFIARARDLLRQTTAVVLEDGTTIAVDHRTLAESLNATDGSLDASIDELSALAPLAWGPPVDPATADARLRALVGEHRARDVEVSFVDAIIRALTNWLASLGASAPDPRVAIVAVGGVGLAVIVLVLAVMGRDLRERFRHEVAPPELAVSYGDDPARHLRHAEDALRAGDVRDAIHALYQYAVASLAAHQLVRYDPSLTDRELLARARAIPHADALRELVALHDLVWYGLRAAREDDVARARSLATRAAA